MMFANPNDYYEEWDFLTDGIATERYYHLMKLNNMSDNDFKVAFKDPMSDSWTKWTGFYDIKDNSTLFAAFDVHRSVLWNEIVIESDYKDYELNYDACRLIGRILESKGFVPSYYFSGSKSIHMHIYFDFRCLTKVPMNLQETAQKRYKYKNAFIKAFMEWLRSKMIRCWDLNLRDFDTNLIRASHLIRSELSRNKYGYKTFLGHTYKDLSFIPQFCNEDNNIKPQLGDIILSSPHNPTALLEEFLYADNKAQKIREYVAKQSMLSDWQKSQGIQNLRPCVEFIASDEFKTTGDGISRGMFILANEWKRMQGEGETLAQLRDWNSRMGLPLQDAELQYRAKTKVYRLPCSYIHEFLHSIGYKDIDEKCNRKIYK